MDNFFSHFLRKREAPTAPSVPGVPSSSTETTEVGGGTFESRIVYAQSPDVACTVSAVYRATVLRADTMGVMPVQYRKKDTEKGNFTTDMVGFGRRMNYLLLEEPNPIMTATDLWRLVEINRLFYGNGFVYIERDEFGFPRHLWLIRQCGYNINNATYASIVYLTDRGYQTRVNVPSSDVLFFPNTFRYPNGLGIPTLRYAYETLTLNKTLRSQALETAAKGGRMKAFISEQAPAAGYSPISQGMFDPGQMKSYAKEINEEVYRQDIVALRGLDKVTPISMTAQDMQMIEQSGMTYDDVARFWGVPRPLLMLDTNSHYNDYQNATMEFHTRTILPQKTGNEKEISRKLIGFKDYGVRDIHICEKPLLAMDPERQAKVNESNLRTGVMTVNEIRSEMDMPAVKDGDIVYVLTNLAELGSAKLRDVAGGGRPATEEQPPADEK